MKTLAANLQKIVSNDVVQVESYDELPKAQTDVSPENCISEDIREQIVTRIQNKTASCKSISKELGIPLMTIKKILKNPIYKTYNENFKRHVVDLYYKKKMHIKDIRDKYAIGLEQVHRWGISVLKKDRVA